MRVLDWAKRWRTIASCRSQPNLRHRKKASRLPGLSRVRIVFLLRHALYLRNFESALRALADQGHEILLVLAPLEKQVDTTLLTSLTREHAGIRQQLIGPRTG